MLRTRLRPVLSSAQRLLQFFGRLARELGRRKRDESQARADQTQRLLQVGGSVRGALVRAVGRLASALLLSVAAVLALTRRLAQSSGRLVGALLRGGGPLLRAVGIRVLASAHGVAQLITTFLRGGGAAARAGGTRVASLLHPVVGTVGLAVRALVRRPFNVLRLHLTPAQPWVWQVAVRRELLEEELDYMRALPYSRLHQMVAKRVKRTVVGRDGRHYRIFVRAAWSDPEPTNIRVTVTVRGPGLRLSSLSDSFVIAPEGQPP